MTDHDSDYRRIFSEPEMVEAFLRGYLPGPWIDRLDFLSLEHVSASFVSKHGVQRHADAVWRLCWRRAEGEPPEWLYLYVLFEFQSTEDPFMAVRLLHYVALLFEDLVDQRTVTPETGLPFVLPVVLYKGKLPWRPARDLESLFRAVPPGLELYLPRLRYVLLDERRLTPAELELPGNLAAAFFRVEVSPPERLRGPVTTLVELLRGAEERLKRTFLLWLKRLMRRLKPPVIIPETAELEDLIDMATILEETLIERFKEADRRIATADRRRAAADRRRAAADRKAATADRKAATADRKLAQADQALKAAREAQEAARLERRKALDESWLGGQVEGKRTLLLDLLEQRFGPLSEGARERVKAIASPGELDRLARQVLSADSLAALGLEAEEPGRE